MFWCFYSCLCVFLSLFDPFLKHHFRIAQCRRQRHSGSSQATLCSCSLSVIVLWLSDMFVSYIRGKGTRWISSVPPRLLETGCSYCTRTIRQTFHRDPRPGVCSVCVKVCNYVLWGRFAKVRELISGPPLCYSAPCSFLTRSLHSIHGTLHPPRTNSNVSLFSLLLSPHFPFHTPTYAVPPSSVFVLYTAFRSLTGIISARLSLWFFLPLLLISSIQVLGQPWAWQWAFVCVSYLPKEINKPAYPSLLSTGYCCPCAQRESKESEESVWETTVPDIGRDRDARLR